MRKISTFTKLSIRIITIFVTLMFVSFIPDYLHKFFGDTYCTIVNHYYAGGIHSDPEWHWGYRHWLFVFMGIVLFFIQIVQTINIFSEKDFSN